MKIMQEGLQATDPAASLIGAVVTRRPKALVADHTSFLVLFARAASGQPLAFWNLTKFEFRTALAAHRLLADLL